MVLLCTALLSSVALAQDSHSWLAEPWRPGDVAVIEVDGEVATEEDLFLWQILRARNPEDIRLIAEESGAWIAENPAALREAAESFVVANLLIAEADPANALSPAAADKAARVLAAQAALVVYADLYVRPHVNVTAFDVANYYQQNRSRYSEPETLEVLALAIPVEDSLDPAQREQARTRAQELRREAVAGGGLAGVVRAHPELRAPRTLVVRKGYEDVPPLVEEALFQLVASQITPPQFVGDSAMLYEVLTRKPAESVPLAAVAEDIGDRLLHRLFAQQMRFAVDDLARKARPISRAQHFGVLEDPMMLVQVRDFELTKGEFLALAPEFAGLRGRTSPALRQRLGEIVRGEVVTQFLEQESVLTAHRYRRARELALLLVRSRHVALMNRLAANPTEDDVREYLAANREALAPTTSRYVWKLEARPAHPAELSPTRRRELQQRMRERLPSIIGESERLLEERAQINGPVALATPQFVVDRLIGPQPEEYQIAFERVGIVTPSDAWRDHGFRFEDVAIGRFSPLVLRNDGSAAAFYMADEEALEPAPEAELLERARAAWLEDSGRRNARREFARLVETGRFQWRIRPPTQPE